MIRILIADDHKIMAQGIKSLFKDEKEIDVLATVSDGLEVLEVLKSTKVDVLLLDIDMPNMNGIDCAKEVLSSYPSTKVAILTMHEENALIKDLVNFGVSAYMLKTIPKIELINAIKLLSSGGQYFSSDVTKSLLNQGMDEKLIDENPSLKSLTKREKEIIKLVAQGNTNPQIGEILFISPKTVDVHRSNIMKKIDVHNVAGLVRFAFQNNLVE